MSANATTNVPPPLWSNYSVNSLVSANQIRPGSLTQTQINALTPDNGSLIYNTTTSSIQGCSDFIWSDILTRYSLGYTGSSAAVSITNGITGTTSVTWDLLDGFVHCYVGGYTATGFTTVNDILMSIPTSIKPSTRQYCSVPAIANNTIVATYCLIDPGSTSIWFHNNGSFTIGQGNGFPSQTIMWRLA